MRLAKEQTVDELLTNSINKIATLDRTLSFPVRGSLILDGTTVYYGNGTAWIPVGGGAPSNVTITGGPAAITTTPIIQPPPDNEYSYGSGSYYYTSVDDGTNQINTLEIDITFSTTASHIAGQDALFVFPAGTVPYAGPFTATVGGFAYSSGPSAGTFGADLQIFTNGGCILGCQQIDPSNTYVTHNTLTWVV